MSYQRWVRSSLTDSELAELELVDGLAATLGRHLDETLDDVKRLHIHGAQSKSLQDHFATILLEELGFEEEVVLTPQDRLADSGTT